MSLAETVLAKLHARPDAPAGRGLLSDEFLAWCNDADADGPLGISRFLCEVWRERTDLTETFAGVALNEDARQRYLLWAHHFLVAETGAPERLRPPLPSGTTDLSPYVADGPAPLLRSGVTIFGYLRAVLGLGDAGRRLVRLVEEAGEFGQSIPYDHTMSPLGVAWPMPDSPDHQNLDILLVAINAAETPRALRALGQRATQGRYIIGLWFWELDQLSDEMAAGLDVVDEVWVTSAFTAKTIRTCTDKPVSVIPLGLDVPERRVERSADTRARFGIPADAIVVGSQFDYWSRIERKNPIGLIDAWKSAFPSPEPSKQVLFLKSINGDAAHEQRQRVMHAIGTRTDIVSFDASLPSEGVASLVDQFDVVASLHRSEGYGLTLLDAMYRGLPVVATGYSGNLAFMNNENSWLVPYHLVPIEEGVGPYPAGSRWAEPDLAVAADHLRTIVAGVRSAPVRDRAERGRGDVASVVHGKPGAAFIRQRLAAIRASRC